MNETLSRHLLIHGTVLFGLGLLTGVIIPEFTNPRMGLSAHLAGVQNGIVLWAYGLFWHRLALGDGGQKLAGWGAIYAMYALWAGIAFAALWGASEGLAIAGAGHKAEPTQELIVTGLLISGSVAILVSVGLVLKGLMHNPPNR